MIKEIKTNWLTALRSGEYVQGTGTLKKMNDNNLGYTYCCLGVLGEICSLTFYKTMFNRQYDEFTEMESTANDTYPPLKTVAGLTQEQIEKLIHINDNERGNFNRIADYIEKEIPAE